ncbi:MAG TPA: hypothetical protein VFX29_08230 [Longimicrobiaceae bacterium]|jgi:hypothetical protein|nr:hypothetical protein [Longimicrobiaceae bacterium]
MQLRRSLARFTPAAALIPALALAACGDSGTGPDRLTRDDIGGDYAVCSLAFAPSGDYPPAVDLLATLETPQNTQLQLAKTSDQFSLLFRLKDGGVTRSLSGTYQLGSDGVTLSFSNAADARAVLLLPQRVALRFDTGPKRLTSRENATAYIIPKSEVERVSKQSYPNAKDQIDGTLSASFSAGGCGA